MAIRYFHILWTVLTTACYAVFFLHMASVAWQKPLLNWDMVAYIGVAESWSASDPGAIYERSMAEAKKAYTQDEYIRLATDNKLSNDSRVFYQQLPFYSIKPLYVAGIYALSALGMEKYVATYALSILGCLMIGGVLFLLKPANMNRGIWSLLSIVFLSMGSLPIVTMARLSTPDSLSIAFSLIGFYAWQVKKSRRGFTLAMLLAQLARPDALLLTLFLLGYYAFADKREERMPRKTAFAIGAAACALYLLVNHLSGNYGWQTLFYYRFFQKILLPADTLVTFTFMDYLLTVRNGMMYMLWNERLQWLAGASIVAALVAAAQKQTRPLAMIIAVVWVAFLCRFALFPAWDEERYYFAYYLLILYAAAAVISYGVRQRVRMPARQA